MALLLSFIFFLSGSAGLVFETLWFRQAGLALGNSVWASSLVLASFMSGLALGNGWAARRDSIRRPLLAYAGLETVVALTGFGLVWLWPHIGPMLAPLLRTVGDRPVVLNAVRLGVTFALMTVPAAAMGATLPVLTRAVRARVGGFGPTLGWLYGVNTLGAVAGALVGETLLVGALGIRGSAAAAAAVNLAAAVSAFVLAKRLDPAEAEVPAGPAPAPAATRVLAAAFVCGAAMLALEVVWFRFLMLFIKNSSLAFALLLAVVLLGIGLGGLTAAVWLKLTPRAGTYLRPLLLTAGLLTLATYVGFDHVGGLDQQSSQPLRMLALALYLTFPVSLLSGLAFTLLGQRAHAEGASEMRTAGHVTLANTLGALAGSVLGGFVLLPMLGVEKSLVALALLYAIAAAFVPASAPSVPARVAGAATLALFVLMLALFPFGLMQRRYFSAVARRFAGEGSRAVGVREGLTETLIYMRRDADLNPPVFRLVTNGFSMSGTDLVARRYMSLYAWWPAAVHPHVERALLISYGCGTTARALTRTPGVAQIDVVDISRDILDASAIVHPPDEDPLRDPRVRVHVEDGRHFLLTTGARYDLITGEPPPPRVAGVVSLYTREYFQLVRSRLAPGGLVTYWLPVDQLLVPDTQAILRGFCDAFEDCSLWNGAAFNWMLVGTNGRTNAADESRFAGLWGEDALGPALRGIAVERPEQMGALFIADAATLGDWAGPAPPLVDDFPHRILHSAEGVDVARDVFPVYRKWMDAADAGRRFHASPFIARLWPPAMREASLAYFEWEGRLTEALFDGTFWQPPSARGLAEVDDALTRSPLRALPLWLLGSNADEQAQAAARVASGLRYDEVLGLGALAGREPARAAEMFGRLDDAANACRRAYALAMAGRRSEVEALARARRAVASNHEEAGFWLWMERRFGYPQVDPAAPRIP